MTQPLDIARLIVNQVGLVLAQLTAEQADALAHGRGQLVFQSGEVIVTAGRPRRSTAASNAAKAPKSGVDIEAILTTIRACSTGAEVQAYLEAHYRELTVPTLRAVAKGLGPTVVSSGNKPDLVRNIVAGTAGFRERSDAMSAGAWSN